MIVHNKDNIDCIDSAMQDFEYSVLKGMIIFTGT